MRREFEFLEAVLRACLGGDGGRLRAPPGLDWNAVEQICVLHGLLPTVHDTLLSAGPPAEIAKELRAVATRLRRRSALLQLEMERLYPRLAEAGCEPMVIKGPALTHRFYPDPTERFFADIDLLVPTHRLEEAVEIARRFGYDSGGNARPDDFYRSRHFHYHLVSPIGAIVELHWDLTRPGDYVRFDVAAIFERARTIRMGDIDALVPEAGDQLLHTASQLAMEGFFDLRRLVDAALILRSGEIGEDLAARAREQGLASTVWLLLALVQEILNVEGPAGLADALAPSPNSRRSIRALDPRASMFEMFALEHRGYRSLLRWLCAPDDEVRRAMVRAFLAGRQRPDTPDPDDPEEPRPPLSKRLSRHWVFTKIVAYFGWRRLSHALRGS